MEKSLSVELAISKIEVQALGGCQMNIQFRVSWSQPDWTWSFGWPDYDWYSILSFSFSFAIQLLILVPLLDNVYCSACVQSTCNLLRHGLSLCMWSTAAELQPNSGVVPILHVVLNVHNFRNLDNLLPWDGSVSSHHDCALGSVIGGSNNKHILIFGLQIFPWPPDQYDMQAANGIAICSVFALIDHRCMSEADASAIPSFLIHTTLPPLVQSTNFSEIFQPFRSFQYGSFPWTQ